MIGCSHLLEGSHASNEHMSREPGHRRMFSGAQAQKNTSTLGGSASKRASFRREPSTGSGASEVLFAKDGVAKSGDDDKSTDTGDKSYDKKSGKQYFRLQQTTKMIKKMRRKMRKRRKTV